MNDGGLTTDDFIGGLTSHNVGCRTDLCGNTAVLV
ncbi:hypothetical protein [Salmonella phage vB_SenS_SB13]|uniref:Uncharacterized protein n=1 Tax=Salmonella phage vB_SenS_SB13 TaxID=2591135 RepID=A0A5J6T9K0_9CAUD|nr:hypothetical protein HWC37_gp089 [Salmonella phage vB_SenS_SB13]QFG07623.1 hypothetical protein [Salmonella phage vB_SenS_SB13]